MQVTTRFPAQIARVVHQNHLKITRKLGVVIPILLSSFLGLLLSLSASSRTLFALQSGILCFQIHIGIPRREGVFQELPLFRLTWESLVRLHKADQSIDKANSLRESPVARLLFRNSRIEDQEELSDEFEQILFGQKRYSREHAFYRISTFYEFPQFLENIVARTVLLLAGHFPSRLDLMSKVLWFMITPSSTRKLNG